MQEEEDDCTFVPHINTSLSTATAPELLAYYGETQREKVGVPQIFFQPSVWVSILRS